MFFIRRLRVRPQAQGVQAVRNRRFTCRACWAEVNVLTSLPGPGGPAAARRAGPGCDQGAGDSRPVDPAESAPAGAGSFCRYPTRDREGSRWRRCR